MAEPVMKLRHDEVLPDELNNEELEACIAEAVRRGLMPARTDLEAAYEALLSGRAQVAAEQLSAALFPNGCDLVLSRIMASARGGAA